MREALGISRQNIQPPHARRNRGDGGRGVRYRASRIIRGENPRIFLGNEETIHLNKLALRAAYEGETDAAYEISRDSGSSKRACENWWQGANPMGLEAFVNAYRNNPRFAAFARYYLLGHQENDPILEIQLQTAMANMDQAAAQLGMGAHQLAAAIGFARNTTITADVLAMDGSQFAGEHDDLTGELFPEVD